MDYGSAFQRAGILTTNEGCRRPLHFEKQHLGEICCIKNEFLQHALLIPDKQRIQNRYSKNVIRGSAVHVPYIYVERAPS